MSLSVYFKTCQSEIGQPVEVDVLPCALLCVYPADPWDCSAFVLQTAASVQPLCSLAQVAKKPPKKPPKDKKKT